MGLDLRDLAVFLAVERQGSFGRAATELMVSQPAVSERIRHLERVVGRSLFERSPRGAALTPAGAALLPYARRCASLGEEALDAARAAEASSALVLAVHSTFASRTVPIVLGALGEVERRVSIRDVHSEQVAALVLDGVADLGFALSASVPRGVIRAPLAADDVVCAVGRNHPLRRASRASVRDLAESLIALNAWGRGSAEFVARLQGAGVDDWRIRFCADASTALGLAKDHGHVAFATRSAADLVEGITVVPLAGLRGWTVQLDLLYRRADRADPVVKAVVAAVQRATVRENLAGGTPRARRTPPG
jgi:DNA-binding transcriptional LysR family regulator